MLSLTHWQADIASISSRPEFQNAFIQLRDPSLVTNVRDLETNQVVTSGNPVLGEGRARIVGIRSAQDVSGSVVDNPTGVKDLRIQLSPDFPYQGRILRNFQIRVLDGGRNKILEDYLIIVNSDVNSSSMATRTLECTVDVEADPGWV